MTKKSPIIRCSFPACQGRGKKELVTSQIIYLPPDPQEFYAEESRWNYNFYRWQSQAEPRQELAFKHYCPRHWAKVQWNCERGCSQEQHFNPNSTCYKQRMKKQKKLRWTYTNNQPITNMTKQQLKKAIQKDINLLSQLLPIEATMLDSDDSETWDPDACSELVEKIEQVKTIIESPNGLQTKLEEWSNWQELSENSKDDE